SFKILIEICKDILYFPIWWYTVGLLNFVKKNLMFLANRQKSLALLVWIKNIYKPMYGQNDWQGVLISIVMRIIQIIFRSVIMFFYTILSLISVIVWIILPLFIFYEIILQITPLQFGVI
ncbi:MAG: hypothetical protein ABH881_00760, partial [bacterium]